MNDEQPDNAPQGDRRPIGQLRVDIPPLESRMKITPEQMATFMAILAAGGSETDTYIRSITQSDTPIYVDVAAPEGNQLTAIPYPDKP